MTCILKKDFVELTCCCRVPKLTYASLLQGVLPALLWVLSWLSSGHIEHNFSCRITNCGSDFAYINTYTNTHTV